MIYNPVYFCRVCRTSWGIWWNGSGKMLGVWFFYLFLWLQHTVAISLLSVIQRKWTKRGHNNNGVRNKWLHVNVVHTINMFTKYTYVQYMEHKNTNMHFAPRFQLRTKIFDEIFIVWTAVLCCISPQTSYCTKSTVWRLLFKKWIAVWCYEWGKTCQWPNYTRIHEKSHQQ